MNPITHFLASWSLADALRLRARDRALATWCGVLPDADGLGVLLDGANRLLGRAGSWYYGDYHHAVLHGVFAAVVIPVVMSFFAAQRLRMFAVGVLAVHFHFLCDVVGSRGAGADDFWPLSYLAPFSQRLTIQWSGQWSLNAWPNIVFTLLFIAFAFFRAIRAGYSPIGVFGAGADRVFVETVRNRWRLFRHVAPSREA
ncbi:MAG: metal-dependent hydrolase [Deltaproteobacteria bacterium]|nr:metal-dependent hydrolase [Deltaproteobacteria bacterium]